MNLHFSSIFHGREVAIVVLAAVVATDSVHSERCTTISFGTRHPKSRNLFLVLRETYSNRNNYVMCSNKCSSSSWPSSRACNMKITRKSQRHNFSFFLTFAVIRRHPSITNWEINSEENDTLETVNRIEYMRELLTHWISSREDEVRGEYFFSPYLSFCIVSAGSELAHVCDTR